MKNRKYPIASGLSAFLLLASACDLATEDEAHFGNGRIVVRAAGSGDTDATGAETIPEFGLYVVRRTAEKAEALAGERLFSNERFIRSGPTYTSSPAVSFPLDDAGVVYDLYGYAPYRSRALSDGSSALNISVATDQSVAADFEAADLVFAKALAFRAGSGEVPLGFSHAMSRIDLSLRAGSGFDLPDALPDPVEVRFRGIRTTGSFDFETEKWTLSGEPEEVVPRELDAADGEEAARFSLLVPPQTAAPGIPLAEISVGGRQYAYTPASEMTFAGGKRIRISLTLNDSFDGVVITTHVTIEDWTAGGDESMGGSEVLPPAETTVSDRDGNRYGILRIGRQYWMDANLRTTVYEDGTQIPLVTDATDWMATPEGAYCYYGNDADNIARYGMLYNRAAVGTRKLCPKGWHVPTVADWNVLGAALGGTINDFGSWVGTAPALKATQGWPEGESATDASGFGALPGGQIVADPNDESQARFYYAGTNGYWWCDEDLSGYMTYCYGLRTGGDALDQFVKERHSGLSVRCVHDY